MFLPLGFPLIIWLHMFNIIKLIFFYSIAFTASGLCSALAFSMHSILETCILWFWKAKLGHAET